MDWIINNTHTGQFHGHNSTILCWIHSHVDRKPTHLSCTDLHYYYILQNVFPHIQALVVDVFGNSFITHEFYNLTHNGKQCLSKCMKKPHAFDGSCIQNDFYEVSKCNFYDLSSMRVTVLDSTMECQFTPIPKSFHAEKLPQVDGSHDDELPQVKLIYPKDLINQYTDVAISDVFHQGKIECVAYIAGFKQGNTLVGTHLIFPRQVGTASKVDDLGMYLYSLEN